jgi:hypothetical protein
MPGGQQPPEMQRDRWDYLERFVGPNWERYSATAEALKDGKLGLSWSWPALFFTEFWLAYRRRFAWTAIFLGFTVAAGFAFGEAGDDVILVARIVMAVFGKPLYLRDGLRRIDRIIGNVPDGPERMKRVDYAGGVDGNAVIVLILLMLIGLAVMLWVVWPYFEHALGRS